MFAIHIISNTQSFRFYMKKALFYSGMLLLTCWSCQQEDFLPSAAPSSDKTAVFQTETEKFAHETRTSLGSDRSVLWSSGDQLAIFQGSRIADKFQVSDQSVGSTNGVFSIIPNPHSEEDEDFIGGTKVTFDANVAIYPFEDDLVCNPVYEGDDIASYRISNVTVPALQTYVQESFSEGSFIMTAVTGRKSDHIFRFKNVLGVLRLDLKGTGCVKKIEVTGNNNENLAGEFTIDVYPSDLIPEIAPDDETYETVTLDCGDGVELDTEISTTFIITLPPTPFSEGFTIRITDPEGHECEVKTSNPNPIERSAILRMPEVYVRLPRNLSRNGTANCYIAPQSGYYYFDASVKGCSTDPIGTAEHAVVIWETFNTDQTPSAGDLVKNVEYDNGRVLFETGQKDGNALIALSDENGEILWSWHIWITDYDPSSTYDAYLGYEHLKVMDRNLGATDSTPGNASFGLVYQWGRKDPFMGSTEEYSFGTTGTEYTKVTSSSIGTDDYARKHPTTFILAASQGNDWRNRSDDSAWNKVKTQNDPCPAGWKVPESGPNGLWKNFDTKSSSAWSFDKTNNGMRFGYDFATSDVWMPAQGFLSDSRSYREGWWRIGEEGRYWSCSTLGNKYAEYFSFNEEGAQIEHISSDWSTHCSRANGIPVRCVEDK